MKQIRIGIFGTRRGADFIKSITACGGEVVAICDKSPYRIDYYKKQADSDIAVYDDFDRFIEHPMDAVLLTNYFHEHAEYAIKCLGKGIHVLSECASNSTMAEGVRLIRAAEKSSAVYMLAENYPYALCCREMKRVFDGGTLGKLIFAEGEYNHPGNPYHRNDLKDLYDDIKHWRLYLPKTYYITHSLMPLIYITGALPTRVTAMSVFCPPPGDSGSASQNGDNTAIIITQNDDGSVYRVTGHAAFGGREDSYRICGLNGQIENLRGEKNEINLNYNSWNLPEGMSEHNRYTPTEEDSDAEHIRLAGHGGGDFIVIREFFDCIRSGKKPDFDVHRATRAASVGILAHRSILNGGEPYDIPDLSLPEEQKKYENDELSPFWYSDGRAPTIPCSVNTDYRPSEKQIEGFLSDIK